MASGDVYRLKVVWGRSVSPFHMVNDFYFRAEENTILDTQEEDLVQAFQEDVLSAYQAVVSSTIEVQEFQVGKAPTFETAFVAAVTGVAGALTGDAMPNILCGVLARYTDTLSRRGRGRVILPMANEASNSATGTPNTTYVGLLTDLATILSSPIGDGIGTATYTSMLWSVADQLAREVTSWRPRTYWGTQRDRRRLSLG